MILCHSILWTTQLTPLQVSCPQSCLTLIHFQPHDLLFLSQVQLQPYPLPSILPLRKWSWLARDDGTISDRASQITIPVLWPQLLPANESAAISVSLSFLLRFLTYSDWVPCACFFHSFHRSWNSFSVWANSATGGCANRFFSTTHGLVWDSPFFSPSPLICKCMQCGSPVAFI